MLYQIKILLFIILFGCGSSDNQTRNRSTSQKDISYYNLQYYSHIDDNRTQIDIAIPKELQKSDASLLPENIVAQYEYLDSNSPQGTGLYTIDIVKLESRNTIQFASEKKYLEIVEKAFYSEYDGSLEEIAKLHQLKTLDLTNSNQITDEGLKVVAKMKNLETLYLSNCTQITDEGLKRLLKLKKLSKLGISSTAITDVGLKEIAKLKNLYLKLELHRTKITDAGLEEITKLKNLRELNLMGCDKITDKGLKNIAVMQQLWELRLAGCPPNH